MATYRFHSLSTISQIPHNFYLSFLSPTLSAITPPSPLSMRLARAPILGLREDTSTTHHLYSASNRRTYFYGAPQTPPCTRRHRRAGLWWLLTCSFFLQSSLSGFCCHALKLVRNKNSIIIRHVVQVNFSCLCFYESGFLLHAEVFAKLTYISARIMRAGYDGIYCTYFHLLSPCSGGAFTHIFRCETSPKPSVRKPLRHHADRPINFIHRP